MNEESEPVTYKISAYAHLMPNQPKYCTHPQRVLSEETHSIYCETCGATLSLYLECKHLVERMERVRKDKAAMEEFYSERQKADRAKHDAYNAKWNAREARREERLIAVGVKVTTLPSGGKLYDYPDGWQGLKAAERAMRKAK